MSEFAAELKSRGAGASATTSTGTAKSTATDQKAGTAASDKPDTVEAASGQTQTLTGVLGNPLHSFLVNQTLFTIDKRYQPLKALGRGSSGVVVSASDELFKRKVAVKKIHNVFEDLDRAKRCLREVRLLRIFGRHHHVVGLIDMCEPVSKDQFEDLYLVMEFMETDLYKTIYSANRLTDEHMQYFIYQILCGLHYIHSAGVIHRDLKPSNVLLNGDCRAKICDFGLARALPETATSKLTEYVVTRWYRAPEVICSDEYDEKIDVWAVGCILAELHGRKPLFRGHDYVEQINLILDVLGTPAEEDLKFVTNKDALDYLRSLKKREKLSWAKIYVGANPAALDLMERMLAFNPAKRISVEDALKHPYLKKYQSELPKCPTTVDFDFEKTATTKAQLQALFWDEIKMVKEQAAAQVKAYEEKKRLREAGHGSSRSGHSSSSHGHSSRSGHSSSHSSSSGSSSGRVAMDIDQSGGSKGSGGGGAGGAGGGKDETKMDTAFSP